MFNYFGLLGLIQGVYCLTLFTHTLQTLHKLQIILTLKAQGWTLALGVTAVCAD